MQWSLVVMVVVLIRLTQKIKMAKFPPAVSLLEYIEVHLVAVEIVVGVENLGDGVVDAGQDLLLVRGHALHAILGHEH